MGSMLLPGDDRDDEQPEHRRDGIERALYGLGHRTSLAAAMGAAGRGFPLV